MDSDDLPLGRRVDTPRHYDRSVLRRIERRTARQASGIPEPLPFHGEDVWRCYEFSWLAPTGLPRVAILTLRVPVDSPCIVESKSLKLYLNGFAGTTFDGPSPVVERLEEDLARDIGKRIRASLKPLGDNEMLRNFKSACLDGLPVTTGHYQRAPELLVSTGESGRDAVHTHLFRTLCPVTGQPDWGSVAIDYRGRLIDQESMLRYLVSYRDTVVFHEVAAEQLFVDLHEATRATDLTVDARFLRRGGIDINPFRSTTKSIAPTIRLPRQ